jgi:hypothetical protein
MSEKITQFFNKRNSPALPEDQKQNSCYKKLSELFQKKQELRLELVEGMCRRPMPAAEPLTPDEMAAVFALMSCTYPMEEVLKIAERFSCDGWADRFDEKFFIALETCSLELKRSGFTKVSRDLIKIGAVTARMHSNSDWAERFNTKIDSSLSQGIRDQPFLKQPGW